jgi:hypothetical protein
LLQDAFNDVQHFLKTRASEPAPCNGDTSQACRRQFDAVALVDDSLKRFNRRAGAANDISGNVGHLCCDAPETFKGTFGSRDSFGSRRRSSIVKSFTSSKILGQIVSILE